MGGNFGVRFGRKLVALLDQPIFDRLEVFDDAVVDDGDSATRQMRVRVGLSDAAVRSPAGVGNADVAG